MLRHLIKIAIKNFLRYKSRPSWGEYLSSSEKMAFHEKEGVYAEQSFFTEFIKGTPENALTEPYSMVLTEYLREKYFGNESNLGRFIKAHNKFELIVTGVIKDVPENSSLKMDYLSPLKLLDINAGQKLSDQWEYLFNGGLILLITFYTISYHTRKASIQNPTEALWYE